MLNLAGQLADGTVTWMAGPRTIETHITPRISRAAENSGRATPPAYASAFPPLSPTTKSPHARPPPSPTNATASWSTTAACWTSKAWKARRTLWSLATRVSLQSQLETFAEGGATDFVANIFDVPGEPDSAQRAYDALKSLVGKI